MPINQTLPRGYELLQMCVLARHVHTNKVILDRIGQDSVGNVTVDGIVLVSDYTNSPSVMTYQYDATGENLTVATEVVQTIRGPLTIVTNYTYNPITGNLSQDVTSYGESTSPDYKVVTNVYDYVATATGYNMTTVTRSVAIGPQA